MSYLQKNPSHDGTAGVFLKVSCVSDMASAFI
jgi:hypothetical protein